MDRSGGGRRTLLGATVGGAGVLAVAGATFLALSAKSDYDAAFDDGRCDATTLVCDEAGLTATSEARGKANLATIIGGVGVVAVGVGIYFLVAGGGSDDGERSSYLVPALGADSIGLAFGGSL